MASQSGFVVENKFIQGLNTQSTALNFPQDACTDTQNCVFDEFGRVSRRPGLDLEGGYQENSITRQTSERWTEYTWYTSAANSDQAFFVQQKGSTLYFFDITEGTVISSSAPLTLDLTDYIPSGSTLDPALSDCKYATGNGRLFVGNAAINPIYIVWDEDNSELDVTTITIKFRDTDGLDDGLAVNNRPSGAVSDLATSNPKHLYNIFNQGWYIGDALTQWDTARSDMPSNADVVSYYRSSDTDAFDNARVTAKSPGTGLAPRGHYILDIGVEDRAGAVTGESGTSVSLPGSSTSKINLVGKTLIGNTWTASSRINDNDTSGCSYATIAGSTPWVGVDLGTTKTIKSARLWPRKCGSDGTDNGFVRDDINGDVTFTLYGKTTAPTSSTDGTSLGSITFHDSTSPQVIPSSNTSTAYRYVWVRMSYSSSPDAWQLAELELFTGISSTTFERPSCIAFFAGRMWFAGLNEGTKGSNLYFSQVATDDTKYGLCYQKNDPTSEDFADLLADDGGVIKIPEMGKVQALYSFQSQLMVFAANGVWLIRGGGSNSFAATGYLVQRVTNIGMISPQSVVDVKGVPCWLAEDGIYTIQYNPDYDSTTIKSLTEESIKNLILSIPSTNKPYVKAAFDRINNYVYWVYNDSTDTLIDTAQQFNKIIIFNAKTSAFFPWTLDNTTANVPMLQGICYVQDGARSDSTQFKIKVPVTYTRSGTTYLNFADFSDVTNWKDWTDYSTLISSSSNQLDYSSYVVAGYRIDAQAMKNFKTNYVWTFMEDESGASLWLQGIWDFTNNSGSGKWSTPQQAYNSLTTKGRTYDDIRVSRRVVRGTGKALQVKYYSEDGKPFTLIGWGLFESGNDAP